MVNEDALERAKTHDEPFVAKVLTRYGYEIISGTVEEDMKLHTDLKVIYNGKTYPLDVKRNSKYNRGSDTFSLTVVNAHGEEFPFSDKAYFAFIDDYDGHVYIILQSEIQRIIKSYDIEVKESKKCDGSKYVLIPKHAIKWAGRTFTSTNKERELLK